MVYPKMATFYGWMAILCLLGMTNVVRASVTTIAPVTAGSTVAPTTTTTASTTTETTTIAPIGQTTTVTVTTTDNSSAVCVNGTGSCFFQDDSLGAGASALEVYIPPLIMALILNLVTLVIPCEDE